MALMSSLKSESNLVYISQEIQNVQHSPFFERVAVGEGGLARHRLQLQVREEVVLREQRDVGRHLVLGAEEEQGADCAAGHKKEQLLKEQRRRGIPSTQDGLTPG